MLVQLQYRKNTLMQRLLNCICMHINLSCLDVCCAYILHTEKV